MHPILLRALIGTPSSMLDLIISNPCGFESPAQRQNEKRLKHGAPETLKGIQT